MFTTGGSQSNLQALLLARNQAVDGRSWTRTTTGSGCRPCLEKLRIFTSADSHFSVRKSASMLGLGSDAVVSVPVRTGPPDGSRGPRRGAGCSARNAGLVPMAVVATAGTTDFGAIDPLAELAAAAREYGAWLHVDAAYGCGLLVSGRHRHLLDGIHRADSVTVDFHKTFFQPVSSSALLVRDARHAAARHLPRGLPQPGAPPSTASPTRSTRASRPPAASTPSSSG